MVEDQTESGEQLSARGTVWNAGPGCGVQVNVKEALDTDLDAYLDRELVTQPAPEVKPMPAAEKSAERIQGVLALAAEETQWLRTLPPPELPAENSQDLEGGECPIPEHLKAQPAPEVSPAEPVASAPLEAPWTPLPAPLPGLAAAPHLMQPGWSPPVAPVAASAESRRMPWIAMGALAGVSAVSVLVAGMLWMERTRLPDAAQVTAAPVLAAPVAAVAPPPARPTAEPVPSKSEPKLPAVAGIAHAAVAVPEPKVIPTAGVATGGSTSSQVKRPAPAVASAAAVQPRKAPQARGAPVVKKEQEREDVEDPYLEDMEDEAPSLADPAPAPAPAAVAKATPPAPPKESGFEELDEDFARELGFTPDATPKVPESKGPKNVYIPPDPNEPIAERLTPAEVQKVVVANRPAIASCVRRHKEAGIPGLSGGRFVMRWSVYPDSGATYDIAMETDVLKGTPLATCLQDLVRRWRFPRHRVQQDPIRFPFVF
ncbi:MAG: AgmX/PglI C-terminal domain-containing protein [Myxococcaceae bacterium]|nr:AgmX/PglI C-terminal domain-containing protein [Myxococcaceae bacterium]